MAAGGGPSVLACLEAALSDDHNAREQGQLWLNQMISSDLGGWTSQSAKAVEAKAEHKKIFLGFL